MASIFNLTKTLQALTILKKRKLVNVVYVFTEQLQLHFVSVQ